MSKIYLILSLFCTNCYGQTAIDQYLTDLAKNGLFNGVALVCAGDNIILEKAYGTADPSSGRILDTGSRFGIGSIYKEFPAVAIMQLVENGQLKVSDIVSEHLDNLPYWSDSITVEHLIRYSSGLPQIPWPELFAASESIGGEQINENLQNISKLSHSPGEGYIYSNNNPILLMKIVESVTGKSFQDYLQDNILQKIGIDGNLFAESYPYLNASDKAIPFSEDDKPDNYKISVPFLLFNMKAAELNTWMHHLHQGTIISKESITFIAMTNNFDENAQSPLGSLHFNSDGQVENHSHHGSSGNYEGEISYVRSNDLYIILLTNRKNRNLGEIIDEVVKLVGN